MRDAEGGHVQTLQRRYAELRQRRLHDLNALVDLTFDPDEKARVMLALDSARAEEIWALTSGLAPDLDDEAARSAVIALQDKALWNLEMLWEIRVVLPADIVDQVGMLYAEMMFDQGADEVAREVLRAVEGVSADPQRRAQAATMRADLLGERPDDRSTLSAYRARLAAFTDDPTSAHRRKLAAAALAAGRLDEAISHYSELLREPLPEGDTGAWVSRGYDAHNLGILLARERSPAAARAHATELGDGGRWIWLSLGIAYDREDQWAAMHEALDHARRLDPTPVRRFHAIAWLSHAAFNLGRHDEAARWAVALDAGLAAVPPDAPDRSQWSDKAHAALRRLIHYITRDPAGWADADAARVFDTYLTHFAARDDAPIAFYGRGALRATGATDCAGRREAARDFRRAYDGAAGPEEKVAVNAGVALVRSLAGCRPPWTAEDDRPRPAPYDASLVSFGERFVATKPPPDAAGEVLDLMAIAHLAAGEDEQARAALERSIGFDGEHVPGAAGHLLLALEAIGDLEAYADWARTLADDPRLSADQRAAMELRAVAASHARAAATSDPAERARSLMAFVARHPDAPEATRALLTAAEAYAALGEWGAAEAALDDAVARESTAAVPGPAHRRLADLLERQGRFRAAAAHIVRWLDGPEAQSDVGRRSAIRTHLSELWRALGEPGRATALLAEVGAARRTALMDGAIEALSEGRRDALEQMLEGLSRPTREQRALVAHIRRCVEDPAAGVERLLRAQRQPIHDRALAACAIHRGDALLADAPAGGADPTRAFGWLDARYSILQDLLQRSLGALPPPQADAVDLRLRLVMVRLLAIDVRLAYRAWPALPAPAKADVAAKVAEAWALWQTVARALLGRSPDIDSERLGEALTELAALEQPETP